MPYLERREYWLQAVQLARALRTELDRRLSCFGLSQARWMVLLHLNDFTHLPTQQELAKSVGVEGPTLARLLDGLEAQGLAERVAMPGDRRAKRVRLLDKACPVIQKIEAISQQLYDECCGGIDAEELRQCCRIQQMMLQNLDRNSRSAANSA